MENSLSDKGDENKPASDPRFVDRASDDIRRGLFVAQRSGGETLFGTAVELLTDRTLNDLQKIPDSRIGILLSSHRAEALKIHTKGQKSLFIELDKEWPLEDIKALADPTLDLANPLRGPFKADLIPKYSRAFNSFIKLMKISRLLPSALVAIPTNKATEYASKNQLLTVHTKDIEDYENQKSISLTIVAKAKVPLAGAEDCTLISFRPSSGGPEHLAILIGGPKDDTPPLIRLHSECFTGDILGSLKCDCGDQLQGAIEKISKAGGGVLIYLAQEGRGVGLASKLKAYALQDQGFDTVDANTRLGFEVDERYFSPAAQILKTLKIKTVKLLTNNPKKVEALQSFGINIIKRVPHIFANNPHSETYLKTKRDRTGHLI